ITCIGLTPGFDQCLFVDFAFGTTLASKLCFVSTRVCI
ncbi:hemoglobin subunit alpha-like, partial [Arapaima gigas]